MVLLTGCTAKLAVELELMKNFFPAEEYHQKYLDKNPGGYCHISESYFHLEQERTETEKEDCFSMQTGIAILAGWATTA